jgi:hypothetical protein
MLILEKRRKVEGLQNVAPGKSRLRVEFNLIERNELM